MNQQEKRLHKAVCNYIKHQYPNVIFTSEQSGLRLPVGVAKYLKATRNPPRGLPDVWILHPNKHFHGLLLELKTSKDEVYRKDGTIRQNEHIQEQQAVITQLIKLGYLAQFVFGFDHAKKVVDYYLK